MILDKSNFGITKAALLFFAWWMLLLYAVLLVDVVVGYDTLTTDYSFCLLFGIKLDWELFLELLFGRSEEEDEQIYLIIF